MALVGLWKSCSRAFSNRKPVFYYCKQVFSTTASLVIKHFSLPCLFVCVWYVTQVNKHVAFVFYFRSLIAALSAMGKNLWSPIGLLFLLLAADRKIS